MASKEAQQDAQDQSEAEERARPRTVVIYEAIRLEGEDELKRSSLALAWSGLAAGLTMTLSLVAMGALASHLPDNASRPLLSALGYPLGYLIVILGRQQLFTENTLTPLLPVLSKPSARTLLRVARLWMIVLATNIIGALIGSFVLSSARPMPDGVDEMISFGVHAMAGSEPHRFAQGVFAGWLIAVMVWLLPLAETAGPFVIFFITYVVGISELAHIIAGSVEFFYAAEHGALAWSDYPRFFFPTLAGNIVGGVTFVTLLAFAQIQSDQPELPP